MEKERLLLSRLSPPKLSQSHLNSLGSSPTNSTSNSMEFHPHHHHQQQQQQQQHNHHNNNHVGVGVGMGLGDLNCFQNLNWENSMMGGGMDNSALSSMVSSPLAPPQLPNSTTTNSLVIRELIGRLGSICNSGDPQFNNSHSTMLELDHQNHQQQPHNPSPSLDPGFCERAAKYSCFNSSIPRVVDNGNGNGNGSGSGKLSRVSSTQSLLKAITTTTTSDGGKLLSRSCTPDNNAAEFEESSASDPNLKDHVNNNSSRKRKAAPKPKPKSKDLPSSTKDSKITAKDEDKSNAKRSKPSETTEKEKVVVESPKDYIHVRARRGQATDSHSLAERVRREKISERMKFLQDLVPGCNKVTGKAVMLDEIINYVQSLQRQVEFLSMKLSTFNPRMEFNMETLLSKDMLQSHGSSALTVHPTDALASTFPYGQPPHQGPSLQNGISNGMENHCSMPLDTAQRLSLSMQLPALNGFSDGDSQLAAFWEDDLQSIVQMGFGQNQGKEVAFQTQNFNGSLPTSHMKVEL